MRLKPYDKQDGFRVWLNDQEARMLLETIDESGNPRKRMAARLGLQSGLRRDEASKTRAVDISEDLGDKVLRVWEDQSKTSYRETVIPKDLANQIETIAQVEEGIDMDDPILGVSGRTLNRWVQRAAETLYAETGDEGWRHLSFHDLRRTWGVRLLENGVLPSVVMMHGGWEDWSTFRDHYLNEFSPHALKRERSKIPWLNQGGVDLSDPENHLIPVSTPGESQHEREKTHYARGKP